MKIFRFLLLSFIALSASANELLFLDNLRRVVSIDEQIYEQLSLQACDREIGNCIEYTGNIVLFALYPTLKNNIPYISLGTLPTPIQSLAALEHMYGMENFFIKQDAVSGGIDAEGT